MTRKIELALIHGSSREGRFCDTVGPRVRREIEAQAGLVSDLVDPAGLDLASTEGKLDLRRRIGRADAFVVVTPELLARLGWWARALSDAREAVAWPEAVT